MFTLCFLFVGFTKVFEMMRDCNKPAVGHNLSFDLTFSLAAFAQQLPQGWVAFKQLVQHWFPGGVWDTKHLARELQVMQSAHLRNLLPVMHAV